MEYVYTTLLLDEIGEEINETNIRAVMEAAGADPSESRVKAVVAALEGVDLGDVADSGMIATAVEDSAPEKSEESDESAPREEPEEPEEFEESGAFEEPATGDHGTDSEEGEWGIDLDGDTDTPESGDNSASYSELE